MTDTPGFASGGSSYRIFDRDRTGPPWAPAFMKAEPLDVNRHWAVAANWRMDHRVSEVREKDDLETSGHFGSIASSDDWWVAQSLYFREELCLSSDSPAPGRPSAYCRATNESNRIRLRIPEFDELVHVGSFNGILRRVSVQSTNLADIDIRLRRIAGQGLPLRPRGKSGFEVFETQVAELAEKLMERGENAVRQATGILVEGLGNSQPPWWSAFAEEAHEAIRSGSATDLCIALGLGHHIPGEWLLAWVYPVGEAGALYRPTVLESNGSPWHFPSPPKYPWGITMPLSPTHSACREVLHRPLQGPQVVKRCTGKILHLETLPDISTNHDLLALRHQHYARLQREFPLADLGLWMPPSLV